MELSGTDKLSTQQIKVDLLGELRRIGVAFNYTDSQEWISVICPFHADNTPSCYIHTEGQYFKCHACQTGGDFAKWVAGYLKQSKYLVVAYFEKQYGKAAAERPIEPSLVDKYHTRIWEALPLLSELWKRGVPNELIRYYRLGEDNGRITIPIPNANKVYVDLLRYSPGAKERKFTHMAGRGETRLYPIEQLHFDNILLCGGPLKAAAAAYELNQYQIGCVGSTGNEGAWPKDLGRQLEGKAWLGICLDIDAAGHRAARKLAQEFHSFVNFCTIVKLPLDPEKYPKGDVSDWLGIEKQPLLPICQSSPQYVPQQHVARYVDSEPEPVTIQAACRAVNANKRLTFRGLVSASEQDSFYLPKTVRVRCDRRQDFCFKCPIYKIPIVEDAAGVEVPPEQRLYAENENLLAMLNAPTKMQRELIRKSLDIPPCKNVDFETVDSYNVNQIRITPDLDSFISFEDAETNIALDAVSVDCDLRLNETYDLTGRIVAHPNTQRATAVISRRSQVVDSLSSYKVQPEQLLKFQPANPNVEGGVDWTVTGIHGKLNQIYTELENHVTHIYERRDMHLLMDLAYHSVLYFNAEGKPRKGYAEVLIVGDSSCGKSDTYDYLARHYGLGQKVDMANATVAGLLGGVSEINRRKYISWGIFCANDRRLLCLEELSSAYQNGRTDILTKMAETRTSGKANIPKIERGTNWARDRIITLSNVLSGRDTTAYNYGVDIIRELINNPQDIRRYDACMVVSRHDVSESVGQYASSAPQTQTELVIPQQYDSLSCRNLVLWGWTRAPEQVEFQDWPHLSSRASAMAQLYVDNIPIVDRGGIRYKLARLAAALAVRTFSHGYIQSGDAAGQPDYQTVLVRTCHVEYVVGFLNKLYTAKSFGYDKFSKAVREQSQLTGADAITVRLINLPYPKDFAEFLLRNNTFDMRDICDWLKIDRPEATLLISDLVRSHAIVRDGTYYRKTPPFILLLQDLLNSSALPVTTTPAYIKGDM